MPLMHYHLIGICGTAMASLAGMLQARGHKVTGSDENVYPPMSTMLEALGIHVAAGLPARAPARPRARLRRRRQRDLARQPGGRRDLEPPARLPLAGRGRQRGVHPRPPLARRRGHARQDDDDQHRDVGDGARRPEPLVPRRRRRAELRRELPRDRQRLFRHRGRRVRHGLLRQGAEVHALPARDRPSSATSSSTTPTSTKTSTPSSSPSAA